jgi:hypothetical protein
MGPTLRRRRGRFFYVGARLLHRSFSMSTSATSRRPGHCELCVSFVIATILSKLCYEKRSVGQSVLVLSVHLGPNTRFLLLTN